MVLGFGPFWSTSAIFNIFLVSSARRSSVEIAVHSTALAAVRVKHHSNDHNRYRVISEAVLIEELRN
jgi:hypothetical protein